MIPKIIHYCWFGGNPLSDLAKKCIASWKKYCPDYEIIEWNESNFDISGNNFVKQAYENKKFAFVADYVRLYAMYNHGGIYMDTDVEATRPLDEFLVHKAFSGFERGVFVPTGIMASEQGFPLFKELLEYYTDRNFVKDDGSLDTITNSVIITNTLKEYGFVANDKFQIIEDFALYPTDYFCPLNGATGKLTVTKNTATIHWFSNTWASPAKRFASKIARIVKRIFGEDCLEKLKKL
ncbi:MAG: glycosyl transferase [Ruminococcaceae bacterium]|nr:glycosyl transferase [Oscillospiraceae bacterium]